MKLATYLDGSRDGQLIVVSRDLSQAHYASHVANRLQQVLDDWNYLSPQLQDLSDLLNAGRARHAFAFDPRLCQAPLPRAYQCLRANAYPRVGDVPGEALLQQLASDALAGPLESVVCGSETLDMDFGAGLAVVTADLPAGCASDRALDGVRLLMLVNETHLQGSASAVANAFAPVAVTPDELGEAWSRGRVHLPLQCSFNGRKVGLLDAGEPMLWGFGRLLARACQTRDLRAGSIVTTGPLGAQAPERRNEWPHGYFCLADKRAMETLQDGQPSTEFLRVGDSVRVEMKRADGSSVFGAIEQNVVNNGD